MLRKCDIPARQSPFKQVALLYPTGYVTRFLVLQVLVNSIRRPFFLGGGVHNYVHSLNFKTLCFMY